MVDSNGTGSSSFSIVTRDNGAPVALPVVTHDRPLQDALALMLERHVAWVAVTEGGQYRGLLGIDDFWNGAITARP